MTQLAALFALISYVVAAPPPSNVVHAADLNAIFPVFNGAENPGNITRSAEIVSGYVQHPSSSRY